jgi:phosphoesterase, MJ0936 family
MTRILVISDIHHNQNNLFNLLNRIQGINIVIFLGDGERNFFKITDQFKKLEYYSVKGNCDFSSFSQEEEFIEISGIKIFFTHGHTYGVKFTYYQLIEKAKKLNANILLFGHTHTKYYEYSDGMHIINPGSLSESKKSYALIDIAQNGIAVNLG